MNDRGHKSRSSAVRPTGWLCASLAAATGLYCIYVPHATLRAAGAPLRSPGENISEEADDADLAENERVQRALYEADSRASKTDSLQRVALWPLKKKSVPPTTNTTRQPLFQPWADSPLRDPFAEADNEAQAKVLAEKHSNVSPMIGDSGFTKSTLSRRRRLLDFQRNQTSSNHADVPKVAGTVTINPRMESEPISELELETVPQTTAATVFQVELDSEARLRSLFEDRPASEEVAPVATVSAASRAPTATDEIRQVSEPDSSQSAVAVPSIPLPAEALLYRAQKAQRNRRAVVSRPSELAADDGATRAPSKASRASQSAIPTLSEPQDSAAAADPVSEPQAVTELPASLPQLEAELPAKARVDEAPIETESIPYADRAAALRPEPAIIPNQESQPGPETVARPGTVPQPSSGLEPVIRAAVKPGLPPVQVLANRPIELPAPEGWSAALKLNARRAARLAALTGRQTPEAVWPEARPFQNGIHPPSPNGTAESPACNTLQQGYLAPSSQQLVSLGKVEAGNSVQTLNAETTEPDDLKNAVHIQGPKLLTQEPAKIPDSVSEPIVVAEYAAHGQSVWWLRVLSVAGVLFGLYGMWCCRIRSTEGD